MAKKLKAAEQRLRDLKEQKKIDQVEKEIQELNKTGNPYIDFGNSALSWASKNIEKIAIGGVVIYAIYLLI